MNKQELNQLAEQAMRTVMPHLAKPGLSAVLIVHATDPSGDCRQTILTWVPDVAVATHMLEGALAAIEEDGSGEIVNLRTH